MNASKCPHCGVRLNNFLYADACPNCHHELEHNTRVLVSVLPVEGRQNNAWIFKVFRSCLRFIES
jgi:hypothetical protein